MRIRERNKLLNGIIYLTIVIAFAIKTGCFLYSAYRQCNGSCSINLMLLSPHKRKMIYSIVKITVVKMTETNLTCVNNLTLIG